MVTDNAPMDWRQGLWQSPSTAPPLAELTFAGDWAPIRDFAPLVREHPRAIYGDLLPVLQESDLRVVNLECPLFGHGADHGGGHERPMVKSGSVLRGRSVHIRGLTCVPFEVATLANNHVFDYGVAGFVQTRDLLQKHRIRFLGAGLSAAEARQPLVLEVKGLKIGMVNFSEGEDLTAATEDRPGVTGWSLDEVAAEITRLKPTVHAVVAICHGGLEYIPFPPPYVARAFKRVAEAGADLIIGHHPHVPQGIQIHGGTPICYSLGNFVFFQQTDLIYRKLGYLVRAAFNKTGLARLRIIPYEIRPRGLQLLTERKREWFFRQLEQVSTPLADDETMVQAWNGFLSWYGLDGFRREVAAIMDQMARNPAKGAAMFRNRLTTLQHRHHWIDALTRVVAGEIGDGPEWARNRAEAYFTLNNWPGTG